MNSVITLNHIYFSYGEQPVLHDISFSLTGGIITGIIGPNGSGKSTLLKLISAIYQPVSGTIEVAGKPLSHWSRRELSQQIAVVPQDTYVPFNYTVAEIIMMGRTPYLGMFGFEKKHDIEIALSIMETTHTLNLSDRYFDQLSGGERQRVLIARALVQEPKILLLDEPTTHLDINHQWEIMELVTRLNQEQQITVLMVTHDLNLAAFYCQHLVLIAQGEFITEGKPKDVIQYDHLKKAYGIRPVITQHPETGDPVILHAHPNNLNQKESIHDSHQGE